MTAPVEPSTGGGTPKLGLPARMVASVALNGACDLSKPVKIKLGLDDDRTVYVKAWTIRDGHLTLVLTDDHDFFPVAHYVLGAPGRSAMRTGSEHKARGMFATQQEKNGA